MRKDRWLWVILFLGAAVRLYGLGYRSLSYDECQQFWASQGNPLVSNRLITLDPPLFALLLHFPSLVSRNEAWLRLLPCLLGILAIPAVYLLSRLSGGDARVARTAAFFLALDPYPIRYSQSLRVYSLTLLLCALLPASFLALRREGRPRSAWVFGILAAAALLTMYGAVWLLAGMGLWLLAEAARNGKSFPVRGVVAVMGGTAAALPFYLMSLPTQLSQGTPASFYADKFLPTAGVVPALRFLAKGTLDMAGYFSFIQPAAGLLFGLLALLGMGVLIRSHDGRPVVFLLAFSTVAAVGASLFRLYPYGGTRQMLFALPLFTICVASGIERLRRFRRGILTTGLLAAIALGSGIFLYRYHTRPGGQEMRPVVRFLEKRALPGDHVLVNKDAVPQFRFYYGGVPADVVWGKETVIRDYLSETNRLLGAAPDARWWLVFSHGWSSRRRIELSAVDPRFRPGESIETHHAAAYLFIPASAGDGPTGGERMP